MATPEQIRAARALLQWKQSDLAEVSGISLPTINNIERGAISPRSGTVQKIRHAMEEEGIVFLDDSGVQRKKEIFDIQQYDGPEFIEKLHDDVFACLQSSTDELRMCALNERMFPKHVPDQMMRYARCYAPIGFVEKFLIKEGDTFLLAPPSAYRWIPKELMGKIPYMVYKNRFSLIMWEEKRVVIVKNQSIADSFRNQFDYFWGMGKKLPPNTPNQLDDPKFIAGLGIKAQIAAHK